MVGKTYEAIGRRAAGKLRGALHYLDLPFSVQVLASFTEGDLKIPLPPFAKGGKGRNGADRLRYREDDAARHKLLPRKLTHDREN
jgi:hypothetical protein